MGYWDATDQIMNANGGRGPACPYCGKTMSPADDHGRFICTCQGGLSFFDAVLEVPLRAHRIPQVDTAGMTNEEKAQIPPVNRLHDTPTDAEAKVFGLLARGPDCMDDPEYIKACKELEKERRQSR